jgi:hypothetical protein
MRNPRREALMLLDDLLERLDDVSRQRALGMIVTRRGVEGRAALEHASLGSIAGVLAFCSGTLQERGQISPAERERVRGYMRMALGR